MRCFLFRQRRRTRWGVGPGLEGQPLIMGQNGHGGTAEGTTENRHTAGNKGTGMPRQKDKW